MRLLSFFVLVLSVSLSGSELATPQTYPLWDGHEAIADYSKRVNLPPTQSLDLGGGISLELVLIPAGKFIMGTPEHEKPLVGLVMIGLSLCILFLAVLLVLIRASLKRKRPQFSLALMLAVMIVSSVGMWGCVRWYEAMKHVDEIDNEHPAHAVTLTQPFYMGKFDLTQEQYQQVMGTNPSFFKGKTNPVENVSWDDAHDFCKRLSAQLKQSIRLPTEAEWEFACRAGTQSVYNTGDNVADLARAAWYANGKSTTYPVGLKDPNFFGLHDMHGNVWQWCQDFYGEDYYAHSEAENPQGAVEPSENAAHVIRGGSWLGPPECCRSAGRCWGGRDGRDYAIGFRVVWVSAVQRHAR